MESDKFYKEINDLRRKLDNIRFANFETNLEVLWAEIHLLGLNYLLGGERMLSDLENRFARK